MRRRNGRLLLASLALAGAGLACNFVTSRLPALAPGRADPSATGQPAPTAQAAEPTPRPPGRDGPIVGTARETRIAVGEGVEFLGSLAAGDYTAEELAAVGRTFEFSVDLDQDRPLIWDYGWCATTRAILDDNLRKMRVALAVGEAEVVESRLLTIDARDGDMECTLFLAVISGWPSGRTTVETRITFEELVNDGLGDYPPGEQVFRYTVSAP